MALANDGGETIANDGCIFRFYAVEIPERGTMDSIGLKQVSIKALPQLKKGGAAGLQWKENVT